ncbi:MAG: LysR family transcriptional regulator, partial [Alphaproteobacteria bacterium]|nr:LysR family transcriptional regulator [Alphaproteobacteria bacterium]
AEAGLGITSIPEEYPGIEGSNLVRVLPKLDPVELPLYYVYPERLKNSKRVIALGEHLEEVLTLKKEK